MNFKSQNNEIYNKDFNLDELVEAIQLSLDSATGPDEMHYQMLKHLPDTSLFLQVRVGSSLSDNYDQEQGVPQGGVLSTTLFSINLDFFICYRSKSLATIERQLQQNLNKIENLATTNGFKFSKSKTQCVHFCQLRKQHDGPVLHYYGSPIPIVEESKFFGNLFDRKLSFIPHIKYLKAKCLKALSLLKVLSHTSWGADRTTLLKLNLSLVDQN